jgi:8-oxo-dGTP pyrophosphatase MutT (NUDIX family)
MTELSDRLSGLSRVLHPLDQYPDSLPVRGFRPPAGPWQPQPAAVLIPIVLKPDPCIVLTVRSESLVKHAGQVALPGGGQDGNEPFPVGTALREAHEEVGLAPDAVRLLGLLDCFDTITAFRILPVVGLIEGPVSLSACPGEVREVFRVPLEDALDLSSYRCHDIIRDGFSFEVWSMRSGHRPIWGATAAILRQLAIRANS